MADSDYRNKTLRSKIIRKEHETWKKDQAIFQF